jgi:hypothetical protein
MSLVINLLFFLLRNNEIRTEKKIFVVLVIGNLQTSQEFDIDITIMFLYSIPSSYHY